MDGFTLHGLPHSFVAILVAPWCNGREVSEWAGHNSVALTLTRYGGLFDDDSAAAVDRFGLVTAVLHQYPQRDSNPRCRLERAVS
jgi:integrase